MRVGLLIAIELGLDAIEVHGFVLEGAAYLGFVGVNFGVLGVGLGLAELAEVYAAFVEVIPALGHELLFKNISPRAANISILSPSHPPTLMSLFQSTTHPPY